MLKKRQVRIKNDYLKLDIQMFADGEISYKITLDSNGAIKSMEKLDKNAEKVDKQSNKLNGTFSKVGSVGAKAFRSTAIAVGGVASALGGLIGYGAKFNAEIEQYQTSFEVMTGSAEEASKLVEDLKKMGAETPFELSDLAETTQLLMNYGFEAEEAKDRLKMLGDISQGSAEKMNRIAMAYGQMSSAGKVQLEDIKQMIEAGFNPLQEISESTGESMASLYDRISKGTISVDEITASMQRSTSEGGKYFQSMEKQSKTVNGQISTLQDNFKSLAGTLSSGFSDSLATEILPEINDALQELNTAFEEGGIEGFADKLGEELANGITAISTAAPDFVNAGVKIIDSLVQGLNENMPSIMTGLTNVAISIVNAIPQILPTILSGILTAIQTLLMELTPQIPTIVDNLINGIIQIVNQLSQAIPTLIPQLIDAIMTLIPAILEHAPDILQAGSQLLMSLADGILNAIPVLLEKLPQVLESLLTYILSYIPQMISTGIQLIVKLAGGLIQAIPQLVAKIPQIIAAIVNGLKNGMSSITNVGKDLIKGLWNGINDMVGWIGKKIKGFGDSVLGGLKDFFGIHSPSTEFAWIGKMNILGLEEGMEDNIPELGKTIDRTIDYETTGLDYLANGFDNYSGKISNSSLPDYKNNQPIYVNVVADMDVNKFGKAFVRDIKTFSGGTKNSYNYGGGK